MLEYYTHVNTPCQRKIKVFSGIVICLTNCPGRGKIHYMEKRKRRFFSVLAILYLLILLGFLIYIFVGTDIYKLSRNYDNDHYINYAGGWKSSAGRNTSLTKLPPSDSRGYITVYNTLPAGILSGDDLNLISRNVSFSVKIDGSTVYVYFPRKNLTGWGTGDIYHNISLSPSDAGKTVTIEIALPYIGESSGRFPDCAICNNRTFYHRIFSENAAAFLVSSLIVFFGIAIMVVHLGMYHETKFPYNLFALGGALVIMGFWTLIESSVLQILIDSTEAIRVLDYLLIPFVEYPAIVFINSIIKKKNKIYPLIAFILSAATLALTLFLRLVFDIDMHKLMPIFYVSYALATTLAIVMFIRNRIYCKKYNLPTSLGFFRNGAICFIFGSFVDIARYSLSGNSKQNSGLFMQIGLMVFMAAIFMQIVKWISMERKGNRQDKFVNSLMQYAMSGKSTEETLHQMLEYMGKEFRATDAYIYEDQKNGKLDNTYIWSAEDPTDDAPRHESVPYTGIVDKFYEKFKNGENIVIRDIEKLKEAEPVIYNELSGRGVKSIITAPILNGSEYRGFFGINNPPPDLMDEVAGIVQLLEYFLSETLSQRDNELKLIQYSYYDQMTGVKNRRAIQEFEEYKLDRNRPYGFVMCDINGLKVANDTLGHEEGDRMIKDVATVLAEVYGRENVYRMGGDEFAAYMVTNYESIFTESVEHVKELLREKGRSASLGFIYASDGNPDCEDVKKQADKMMYEDKARYYAGRNDRRAARR